ncbi:DUF1318 domain-containing protein [Desulfobacter hydrogenophilus]|uniref:DUF1318 domain-containing protein n=1 Tax=Desulfobacter hydrogenophilus TaxID=2291 RepID=UPI001F5E7F04|nr:DUF1318 domain-containing protein [Desulfobacter hydrogenophilus]
MIVQLYRKKLLTDMKLSVFPMNQKITLGATGNFPQGPVQVKILAEQNVSIQLVQKRRAADVFSNGTNGHYYQNKSGAWVKK